MRTEVSLKTRIKDQCALAGYDYEYLYRFGKKLLKLYRDVSRNNTLDAEDILEDICSESYESDISSQMSSALTRLEFFASEYTKNKFESDIRRSLSVHPLFGHHAIRAQLQSSQHRRRSGHRPYHLTQSGFHPPVAKSKMRWQTPRSASPVTTATAKWLNA